jgi:predicted transcriptional regulator
MTTREKAHMLLDELPESEIEPVVEFIASRGGDPVLRLLENAPEEDEEISAEEEAAAAEGRADIAAGRTVSLEEIKREFGLA